MEREYMTEHICRVLDVPPWLVTGDWPIPRFPRIRWALRRVWPLRQQRQNA